MFAQPISLTSWLCISLSILSYHHAVSEKITITDQEFADKIEEYNEKYIQSFQLAYITLRHISTDTYPLIIGPHPLWEDEPVVSDRINDVVKKIDESMVELATVPGFEDAPSTSPLKAVWQPLMSLRSKVKAYLTTKVAIYSALWATPGSGPLSLDLWVFIKSLILNTGFHANYEHGGTPTKIIQWFFSATDKNTIGADAEWTLNFDVLKTRVDVISDVIATMKAMKEAPVPFITEVKVLSANPELEVHPADHFEAAFESVQTMIDAYLSQIIIMRDIMFDVLIGFSNSFLRED
ncbi:hypothetical protein TWF694_000338 [Orbilia ellipsospora]|uniref:Uncharacterized protein n=1 Tax=Orbilia ellipsospora TaxID=2528407 RepID=A0AAV9XPP5_9PEZI